MLKVFPFKIIADKFLHNVKLDENYERIYDFIYNSGWEPIFGCFLNNVFYDIHNYSLYYHLDNELRIFYFKIPENFNKMNGIIQTTEMRIKGKKDILNYWIHKYMNIIHKLKLSNIFDDHVDVHIKRIEVKNTLNEDGLLISNIVFYKMRINADIEAKTKIVFVRAYDKKEGFKLSYFKIANEEDYNKNKYLSLIFPKTFEYINDLLKKKERKSLLEHIKDFIK